MKLTKFKYICLNNECKNDDFVFIVKGQEQREDKEPCECCGKDMKLMGEVGFGGYNKFNSLSSDEKSKMLLKRSHNHFNKFIKDKKEHFGKTFQNEVKDIVKK